MPASAPIAPYVARALTLPAMPEVAQKLLRSFDRDDLSLHELSGLIGCDATLAAKVMRLANSARFSPAQTIATVKDAAAALGLANLRDLTLSACMSGALPQPAGFDRLAFWRSTLAVGCYAQLLARLLDLDEDIACVSGLMLRSGQVLMALERPQAWEAVTRYATTPDSRIGCEQATLGCTHPEVSAELARHWRFPEQLADAFRAAADPLAARPFNRMGAALRLASVLADCGDLGIDRLEGLRAAQGELMERLHIDEAWLQAHLPDHGLAGAAADGLLH